MITDVDLLEASVYVIAGLSLLTVIQRVWHVRGELVALADAEPVPEDPDRV